MISSLVNNGSTIAELQAPDRQEAYTDIAQMQKAGRLEAQTRLNNARNGVTAQLGDTVSISEQARAKLAEKFDSGEDKSVHQINSGLKVGGNAGVEEEGSGNSKVDMLRKKLEQARERLQDAQQRLSRAQSKASSGLEASPRAQAKGEAVEGDQGGAEAAVLGGVSSGMAGSEEVKTIQNEIRQINNEIVQLNQQLQEALKAEG